MFGNIMCSICNSRKNDKLVAEYSTDSESEK